MTTALIDADLICYRCAASAENEPEEVALIRTDTSMRDLLTLNGFEEYKAFLTGPNNFRKKVNPEYKANRKDVKLPQWLNTCRDFLVKEWKAEVTDGYEADDALGMEQTDSTVICSLDKDLKQIPGNHFNWVKNESSYVQEDEGIFFFFQQLLIGDSSDNIKGIDRIGPKKSQQILDPFFGDYDGLLQTVRDMYNDDERLEMNGKCLWIWRKKDNIWQLPS